MTGFSADWLQLREPFDGAARSTASAVVDLLAACRDGAAPWQVTDLACGSGANLRALAPRLGLAQHWRLVDKDPALLAAVPQALERWAAQHGHRFEIEDQGAHARALHGTIHLAGPGYSATVTRQRLDLAQALDTLDLPPAGLVTASALLDLVSAPWLQGLIGRACSARAPMLFALNVDGRIAWNPADPDDGSVQRLFTLHQRRDKGFGASLGPQAADVALQQLAAAGWRTRRARSDWHIDGAHAPAMLRAMIDGTAAAAIEQSPADAAVVQAWARRRRAGLHATGLQVGHVDIAGVPPG